MLHVNDQTINAKHNTPLSILVYCQAILLCFPRIQSICNTTDRWITVLGDIQY